MVMSLAGLGIESDCVGEFTQPTVRGLRLESVVSPS
jgi:hypothetical protein